MTRPKSDSAPTAPTLLSTRSSSGRPASYATSGASGVPVNRTGKIAEGNPVNILDEGIRAGVHFTHQFGIPGIAATQIVADQVHDLDRTAERKVSRELT